MRTVIAAIAIIVTATAASARQEWYPAPQIYERAFKAAHARFVGRSVKLDA
ncbi:hypothetical protein [Methylobacterium iners]|uniref:Uncharacterized protein n=1 Tax=Methylobacterium iners TaxID=418707 RepID=A0ABQ4S4G6_9HYPH|nr:hypothetical protein [Methylobacterium iners]GJD97816.1 hypothetical protein OCOJLMKI_5055 [Methylobacterium iners]